MGALAQQSEAAEEYVEECIDLFAFVEESDAYVLDEEPEILAVIERNQSQGCERLLARLTREADAGDTPQLRANRRPVGERQAQTDEDRMEAAEMEREERSARRQERTERETEVERETETDVATAQATRTVEEEVTVQETVTVTGDVEVAVPVPDIEVEQSAAEIRVQEEPPRVTVDAAQHEILIQEQPLMVRLSAPTVTIEQAPPEIIITMPDPSVDVASTEPQVVVRQPEPQVRVTMGEPEVSLDLRAVSGDEAGEQVRTRVSRLEREAPRDRDGMRLLAGADDGMDANVYVGENEANVEVLGAEREPEINISQSEPELVFERADPVIEMEGEPEVRFERSGEPTVTVRREGDDRQASRDRSGDRQAAMGGGATTEAAVRVSELLGAEIEGANGEEIGEIERIVRIDGGLYAMVEHGGFLGIGEDMVAVPLSRLTLVDGELMAPGMTEEAMERLAERDVSGAVDLRRRDGVRIRNRG